MKPADVERLLLALLPALALSTGACDSKKEDGDKPNVAAEGGKAAGDGKAADDGKAAGNGGPKLDVGTQAIPPPPEHDMPSCPSGTWCGPKKAALKIAEKKKPASLGCPPTLAGGPEFAALEKEKVYEGLWIGSDAIYANIDEPATEEKRKAGDADTCCYRWVESCPGGRPCLDERGAPVTADLREGEAWLESRFAIALPDSLRSIAAEQWLKDAAMEHASVASFNRASLELMAVGAPPHLLRGHQQAALDEIEHARSCVSLATACGGAPREPGAMKVPLPREPDLARLAADTFVEGCVGETTAALVMERAAAGADDDRLKSILSRIAGEESDHAALAWATVAWAVEQGGARVLEAVERRANELRNTLPARVPSAEAGPLAKAGRLSEPELVRTRLDAWHGIVEPMLARLAA